MWNSSVLGPIMWNLYFGSTLKLTEVKLIAYDKVKTQETLLTNIKIRTHLENKQLIIAEVDIHDERH